MSVNPEEGWSKAEWIRALFRRQLPFGIRYKNDLAVFVDFDKNKWILKKYKQKKLYDEFSFTTDLEITVKEHGAMLAAFANHAIGVARKEVPENSKEVPVRTLERILTVWAGTHDKIVRIERDIKKR